MIKNFETPYNEILADFESYRRIQINNELLKLCRPTLTKSATNFK